MERQQFAQSERWLRKEFRRHFLSERERIIADLILELSFGIGLRSVRIPKLEVFSDLTGIDRSHVHSALKNLHEMRIVQVSAKDGVVDYSINPDSEAWKVRFRVPRETIRRAIEVVKAYNGMDGAKLSLGQGQGAELNFRGTPHAQTLAAPVTESVTVAPNGDEFPDLD